jgi:16S rRNA (cytidine1402-2'-O)-methyltransferase
LKTSDLIIAEDTRITQNLLNYYQIKTRVISYHKFNEIKRSDLILKLLDEGKTISLVSDAGTPLLSDPGFIILDMAIKNGIKIEVLPGPTSIMPALLLSGFNPDKFIFYGFLSKKNSLRYKELKEIEKFVYPVIIFESPNRIIRLLDEILEVMGDRKIAVIKELTKLHENVFRGKISEVKLQLNKENIKGEFIVALGNNKEIKDDADINYDIINSKIDYYLKSGKTKKETVSIISEEFGLKRNESYKIIHKRTEA